MHVLATSDFFFLDNFNLLKPFIGKIIASYNCPMLVFSYFSIETESFNKIFNYM
ncbi:hypothetical protein O3M35_000826 [Rhynocoris fuscipes]|uniref:Uncharacterized protein n=1 Tax=Rhynocoris fuscipes TaxID=488301 RepID=A0AAW1DN32_9HEMI